MFRMIKRLINWTGNFKKRIYIGFVYAFINSIFTSMPIILAAYGMITMVFKKLSISRYYI